MAYTLKYSGSSNGATVHLVGGVTIGPNNTSVVVEFLNEEVVAAINAGLITSDPALPTFTATGTAGDDIDALFVHVQQLYAEIQDIRSKL